MHIVSLICQSVNLTWKIAYMLVVVLLIFVPHMKITFIYNFAALSKSD